MAELRGVGALDTFPSLKMMEVESWGRDLLSQIRWSSFGLELYTVEVKLCVLGKGIDKNILSPAGWLRG